MTTGTYTDIQMILVSQAAFHPSCSQQSNKWCIQLHQILPYPGIRQPRASHKSYIGGHWGRVSGSSLEVLSDVFNISRSLLFNASKNLLRALKMGIMFDTPTFELHADHGPLLIRTTIAMTILSFIAICLRFLARRLVRQPILWDDWMIVLAVLFAWVTGIWEVMCRASDSQ